MFYNKKKIAYCRNSLHLNHRANCRNFDTPNTHIHDRSLPCLGTGTLLKVEGFNYLYDLLHVYKVVVFLFSSYSPMRIYMYLTCGFYSTIKVKFRYNGLENIHFCCEDLVTTTKSKR